MLSFIKSYYLLMTACLLVNFCSAQKQLMQISGTVVDSVNQLPGII